MVAPKQRLRWLEDVPGRGCLYEISGGEFEGSLVLGPSGIGVKHFSDLPPPERQVANQVAEELLCSLLDKFQLEAWSKFKAFWVDTATASFRLGTKYDIRCRWEEPAQEVSVCVVPKDWNHRRPELPDGDFWVNVLLMLIHDPTEFGRAAFVRSKIRDLRKPERPCATCGRRLSLTDRDWKCMPCWTSLERADLAIPFGNWLPTFRRNA